MAREAFGPNVSGANEVFGPNVVPISVGDIPVITLVGSSTIELDQGTPYVEPGYSATDTEDGDITNLVVVVGSVDENVVASYPITYDVTDSDSNPAVQVIRTVNVVEVIDTEAPVISLIGSSIVTVIKDGVFVDPGAVVLDNVDPDVTIFAPEVVDTSFIHSAVLTYNHTDVAGNPAIEVLRTVNVIDFVSDDCFTYATSTIRDYLFLTGEIVEPLAPENIFLTGEICA